MTPRHQSYLKFAQVFPNGDMVVSLVIFPSINCTKFTYVYSKVLRCVVHFPSHSRNAKETQLFFYYVYTTCKIIIIPCSQIS